MALKSIHPKHVVFTFSVVWSILFNGFSGKLFLSNIFSWKKRQDKNLNTQNENYLKAIIQFLIKKRTMWMNIHFAKCAEKFVESANLDGLSSSRSSHRSGLISRDGSSIWEVFSLLFQKYLSRY